MRTYAWLEFIIWLIIVAVIVLGVRYHHYKVQKQYKSYQIFMEDVDGLIAGSPVRFLGVQIGYVKKIRVISSNVYIKFVITQKGLTLPVGSVATVEASGLGGSKSLEIYPPPKNQPVDKIIATKDPTRLGKVMSLFEDIFRELDVIFTTMSYAGHQLDYENSIQKNLVEPEDMKEGLIRFEKSIDSVMELDKKFKNSVKGKNKQNRGDNNEYEQSESDK